MKHRMKAIPVTSEAELDAAFQIRKVVFVDEQGVDPKIERDPYDATAEHVLVYDYDLPVGTGRWRIVDGAAKFERVCVLAGYRKHGFGKAVMDILEREAKEAGLTKAKLHAQTQVEHFYRQLGYQTISETFFEEGIPHVTMAKELV